MSDTQPLIRRFEDAEPYTQPEPGDAQFRWLLKKDEVPGLASGLVTLRGPIHKTPAAHEEWEQVYIVLSGSAVIHLSGATHRVQGPTIIVIPKGAWHSVQVAQGEQIQYVFLNQYR